jgi:adenylate kinase
MKLVLLGAPGAGKGTHSEWMTRELGIPQISTGDILRDAVAAGTELGQRARGYMDAGQLVPDEVILGLVRARLAADDARRGFILDGFPRTIPQAEGLGAILAESERSLDRVLRFEVPHEELVVRLTSRRVCPNCKAVYNISFRPPQRDEICDVCGAKIVQREDDRRETVLRRLQVYEDQTAPLVDYYRSRELLEDIDGSQGFEAAQAQIRRALGL